MKHAWIAAHQKTYPIGIACEVLGVSTNGYHDHRKRRRQPASTPHRAAAVMLQPASALVPFEVMTPPKDLDGFRGKFRAPKATCVLAANNDYEAVQAWLSLQESETTRRTYRKEAERLLLWAIVERGRALSSLMTEDAIAYRAFLRRPHPHARWIEPVRSRVAISNTLRLHKVIERQIRG